MKQTIRYECNLCLHEFSVTAQLCSVWGLSLFITSWCQLSLRSRSLDSRDKLFCLMPETEFMALTAKFIVHLACPVVAAQSRPVSSTRRRRKGIKLLAWICNKWGLSFDGLIFLLLMLCTNLRSQCNPHTWLFHHLSSSAFNQQLLSSAKFSSPSHLELRRAT